MIQRFPKLSNYSSTQLRAGQSKPRNKHSTANTWTLTKHHVRMESKSTINSTAESWIKISTGRSQLNRSIGSLGPDAASLWPSSLPPSGFSSVSSVLSSTSPGPPPPREDKHLGWLSGILVGLCPVWPRSCGGTSWNLSSPDVKTLKPNEPTGA